MGVFAEDTPRLARLLLAATIVCFGAVLLRNGFGLVSPVSPVSPAVWDNLYSATQLLAVGACALRAATASGRQRAPWIALTLGLFGFAVADVYYAAVLSGMESPPFPSLADAGYLSIYPGAYAALVLLLRAVAGRVPAALWIDGLVCALGVAGLGAALVFGVVASTDGSLATVATNLAYPLGDLAMLAFVIAVMTVTGWRPGRTWVLVALGFAVFAIADVIYLFQTAVGSYEEYTPLDAAWPAAYVLIAMAAWQPLKRLDARRLHGAGMLALPASMAVVSLGMLVVDHYHRLNEVALWLASASVGAVVVRFALTFRQNLRMLRTSERDATTDALTGLGNRRALLADLDDVLAGGVAGQAATVVLALFDLDGFKSYNDAFGHPAGDALLERLGQNLAAAIREHGTAYRMGGDEFCVLARASEEEAQAVVACAAEALSEQGERFSVGSSYGMVLLPLESRRASDALRVADQRMYAHKNGGRISSEETIHRVLLSVVGEHDGALRHHVDDVARLADMVGRQLGVAAGELTDLRRAAALHDIGKVAIPDAILQAPRPLKPDEWEYMRQHTVIGARIISAAPELAAVARIVRASHERLDGAGYPDGLPGCDIPRAARIIAVCDSYDAMVTDRPYRAAMTSGEAMAELRRCSGSQFDPEVVDAFAAVLSAARQPALTSAS